MADKGGAWNTRNPAVKRIVQELKEIQRDDDPDILAEAIEDNIFEWHFVIRGAWDSEFEGGIYHGRILMPAEYPFKPPAFVMLTPSGRFETGVKICLSISSHHPESWQPSWSVRSALVALRAFMQTPGNGALGSLDHPEEARRQMAAESRTRPPTYGTKDRQQLIAGMHQRMEDQEERSRQLCKQEQRPADGTSGGEGVVGTATAPGAGAAQPEAAAAGPRAAADAQAQVQAPAGAGPSAASSARLTSPPSSSSGPSAQGSHAAAMPADAELAPELTPKQLAAIASLTPEGSTRRVEEQARLEELRQLPHLPHQHQLPQRTPLGQLLGNQANQQVPHRSWEDRGLTYLAVLLALAIAALVIRKVLVAFTFQSDDLYTFNHVEGVEL